MSKKKRKEKMKEQKYLLPSFLHKSNEHFASMRPSTSSVTLDFMYEGKRYRGTIPEVQESAQTKVTP